LVIRDADTGELVWSSGPDEHEGGLRMLQEADLVIGHNIIDFDLRAIRKVYPWFHIPNHKLRDTLLMSRILWPDVVKGDFLRVRRGQMPASVLKRPFSLEAWGYRLGTLKGEYAKTADWSTWTPEMQEYCEGDTVVNLAVWRRVQSKKLSAICIELEHDIAVLTSKMTENGFHLDVPLAERVLGEVETKLAGVRVKLQELFPPIETTQVFIPKVNNSKLGYQKGIPFQKRIITEFNPGSREQIAKRLTERYGWRPTEFTPTGEPKIDEPILESMPFEEAKVLLDYLALEKRQGSLVGKQGWLKLVGKDGFLHPRYNTTGALGGRATHSQPNITQVTKHCDFFGTVFRQMFIPPPNWLLVGADMSGLELRCLAAYLSQFDDGAYIATVVSGDVHTANMIAAGLATRDQAKTFIYAFLYGAGNWKLGHIVDPLASDAEKERTGALLKKRFTQNTPGLHDLRSAIDARARTTGVLLGLDGRPLPIRHRHAAPNLLLQSTGAILCKRWGVLLEKSLLGTGLRHGWDGDFAFVAWAHDEYQIAARTQEVAEIVAATAIKETSRAGEDFDFPCPLTGEAKIGINWAETH